MSKISPHGAHFSATREGDILTLRLSGVKYQDGSPAASEPVLVLAHGREIASGTTDASGAFTDTLVLSDDNRWLEIVRPRWWAGEPWTPACVELVGSRVNVNHPGVGPMDEIPPPPRPSGVKGVMVVGDIEVEATGTTERVILPPIPADVDLVSVQFGANVTAIDKTPALIARVSGGAAVQTARVEGPGEEEPDHVPDFQQWVKSDEEAPRNPIVTMRIVRDARFVSSESGLSSESDGMELDLKVHPWNGGVTIFARAAIEE